MRLPFNDSYPITQGFGDNPPYYAKYGVQGHDGIDYGLPYGTPVVAPHDGKIIECRFDSQGYGNYIKIESDIEGSVLAHLSLQQVQVGFIVQAGDQLGLSGNSGDVQPVPTEAAPHNGSHLHWGYYRMPRNRNNGMEGFIDQTPYLTVAVESVKAQVTTPKHIPGDTIEPIIDIPVGKTPGTQTMQYGHIGPKYPAKIEEVMLFNNTYYYNVDQSAIGGGTGWVDASMVDPVATYVLPVEQPPVETVPEVDHIDTINTLVTQLNSMQKERDSALSQLKVVSDSSGETTRAYAAFVALGYSKAEDLTTKLKIYDDTIVGLQKQIVTTTKRNADLAQALKDKEDEDATAIEHGIDAMQELAEARNIITAIAKKAGTSNKAFDLIYAVEQLKSIADSVIKKGIADTKVQVKPEATTVTVKNDTNVTINWLTRLFGVKGGE